MKYFRVEVIVNTWYDIIAENEEQAEEKAYDYMINGYSPTFEVTEIDEDEYEGA